MHDLVEVQGRLALEARRGLVAWLAWRAPLGTPPGRVLRLAIDRSGVTVVGMPHRAWIPRRMRADASTISALRLRIEREPGHARFALTVHAQHDVRVELAVKGLEDPEAVAIRVARALGLTHYRPRELAPEVLDVELLRGNDAPYRGAAAIAIPAIGERFVQASAPEPPLATRRQDISARLSGAPKGSFTIEGFAPGERVVFHRSGAATRERGVYRALSVAGGLTSAIINAVVLAFLFGVIALAVVGLPWLLVRWLWPNPIVDRIAVGVIAASGGGLSLYVIGGALPSLLAGPLTEYRGTIDWQRRLVEIAEAELGTRKIGFADLRAIAVRTPSARHARIDLVCAREDVLLYEHREIDPSLARELADVLAAELAIPLEA